jgi:mRNA interferase RelE/StbE
LTETYKIRLTSRFEKDFRKLPKSVQRRISEVLGLLARNPFAFDVLSGEFKGLRKIRVGDYRIVYRIDMGKDENMVHLLFVAHRRSVYK